MANRRIDYTKPPEIEDGIPIPEPGETKRRYYAFGDLRMGQSMFFPLTRATVHWHLRKWKKRTSSKVVFATARMVKDGVEGTRVWRKT